MRGLRLRFIVPVLGLLLVQTAHADLAKLDPRARVALAQLQQGAPIAAMLERASAVSEEGQLDVFIVGNVSRSQLEAAGAIVRTQAGDVFTAFIPVSAMDTVAALAGVSAIRGAAPVETQLDASIPTTNANNLRGAGPAFTGLNGAGVLVGDVDTGVDYDHGDFRDAFGNTRLVNIWDQTDVVGPNPSAFAYGSEWTPADINAHIARQVDVSGHGTHCMGIMGGDGSGTGGVVPAFTYVGMAPMADLIEVKTTLATTAVADGVNYIMGRATALGKNCVVNLSLGSQFGPHDGTSPFESSLTALSGPGRIVCVSEGNDRGVARHANVFAAGAGTNVTLSVSGSGAGRTIAIDGYYEASENLNVRITTPLGTVIGPITLGNINAGYPGTLTTNGNVYLENGLSLTTTGDKEVYIEINVPNPTGGATATGTWTFTFIPVALGAANGEVDLWRFFNNTTTANFVIGNQNTARLTSEPANAVGVLSVAAYETKRVWTACDGLNYSFSGAPLVGALATFSSPGPTRDNRQKPDLAAPGTAIVSATSFDLIPAPVCSPLYLPDGLMHTVNQGTSMAAPHVTGAIALLMQKYGAITPAFAKTFLNARAKVDANTGAVWNKDWGNGKLFLGDMINPTVTVVVPNGGEVYLYGQAVNLQWNAADNVGVTSVDLQISRNGLAGPFTTIAAAVPNTGSYPWIVDPPASNNCLLRVVASDLAGNTGQDDSDAPFAIIDGATSTLLSQFSAEGAGDAVELRWSFTDPTLFSSVAVERSPASSGPWEARTVELRNEGTTTIAVDRSVTTGETYFYRLVAARGTGSMTFGPLSATVGEMIAEFALSRLAPNPSNGPTRAEFTLPRAANVKLQVIDPLGRVVATLVDGAFAAGRHQAMWSGEISGRQAPAGLYFIRYTSPDRSMTRRVVITH
jgi:subtilisin family serine protease